MRERDIFIKALRIGNADERFDFVQESCGDDQAMRQRIAALLGVHQRADAFLESPPTVRLPTAGVNAGTKIGPFTLLKQLGRGAMGVVYEAEEVSLGRRVALKILPFAALLNETQLERFNIEAMAAARLQHAGIVTIYSVGCERGIHYYSMQLIEGPSLADVITELRSVGKGRQEPADTVVAKQADVLTRDEDGGHCGAIAKIGREAAEALHYAHDNGVLHRDIKPSNLLLDKSGHVWIADFGLARVEDESQLTRTGDILGTLRYMSPEQAIGERVDARSDVYSLGATLYELATLQPVFDAEDRRDIVKQVIAGNPIAAHKVDTRIPEPLSLVISKSMAKRLDERYQSAQELADDLRRCLDGEAVLARSPSPLRRARATLHRHPIVTISSIALLIVACLYISNVLHRRDTNEPDNSSVTSSTDTRDPTMFRSAPKKRTARKNDRIRSLRHEQLEDRRLLAGVELSIDDVTAVEGDDSGKFVDDVAPQPGLVGQLDGTGAYDFGPDGNLYVASHRSDEILRYHPITGEFIDAFVPAGHGGLDAPWGLTFHAEGDDIYLYVASVDADEVLRYNAFTGDFVDAFINADNRGSLDGPGYVLFGPDDSLYVASLYTNEVMRFNDQTESLDVFVEAGSGGLSYPHTFVFDSDGSLYVTSSYTDQVLRYDVEGAFSGVFVSSGSGGLDSPSGLIFGTNGDLYVCSHDSNEVLRYDADGRFASVFVPALSAGLFTPQMPLFVGNKLYVGHYAGDSIISFNALTGAPAGAFIISPTMNTPKELALDDNDNLYVANFWGGSVKRYGPSGEFLEAFVRPGSGGLAGANGLAYDSEGNLYVTSYQTDSVLKYDQDGAFIDVFVESGSGGLCLPADLTFDPLGNLYVTSSGTRSVLKYEAGTGRFVKEWVPDGGHGFPSGITFGPDDDNLYVTWSDSCVRRYDGLTGAFIDVFASEGNADIGAHIEFGPDGHVYVSSYHDHRVLRYDGTTGNYIDDFVPAGDHGIFNPSGLAFDSNGLLYVANNGTYVGERDENGVLRYGPESVAVFTVSLSGPSDIPVTVDYVTAPGSADSGVDFKAITGKLIFDPGVTTRSIIVPTIDDLHSENDETFYVTLSNPTGGATIPGAQEQLKGTATIIDFEYSVYDNNVPKSLKDAKRSPGVTTSTIEVTRSGSITDVNVELNISHTYDDQLTATLIAPDATRVELFSNVGGPANNFTNTVLDDAAAISIATGAAPFTGTYQPEGSLADFNGIDAAGTWTLEIVDSVKRDTGTLNSWSLEVAAVAPPPTPGVTVDPIDGLTTTEAGGQANFTVVLDSQPTSDVTIGISSSDPTEGTADTTNLVFDTTNWNVAQTVTITGEDDSDTDGDIEYTIETLAASSSDPAYNNMPVDDVAVVNRDDDVTGTALYVFDIRFVQHGRKADWWQAVFEIRADADGNGVGGNDTLGAGVAIEVDFAGKTFTGTTASDGTFTTNWVKGLSSDTTYYANVVDLVLANYYWNALILDLEDDSDGDGKPDNDFSF